MRKKKILIICLSVIILMGILLAAYFFLFNPRGGVSTEKMYEKAAKEVEKFTYDKDTGLFYVNNEVVVIAAEDASESDIKALAKRYDGTIGDAMTDIGVYCLSFDEEMDAKKIDKLAEKLKAEAEVEDAYLNPVVATQGEARELSEEDGMIEEREPEYPNDDWDNASWDESVPRGNNWGVEAIHAPTAWAYLDELSEVNVGLIDSVPTTEHPDLDIEVLITKTDAKSNYYSTESREVSPDEAEMHGCHVAGTIGAAWDNDGTGVSGVIGDKGHMYYHDATTMSGHYEPSAARSGLYNGTLTDFYTAYDYVKGIKVLVNNDVRAINISLTTGRTEAYAASKGNKNAIEYIERQAAVAERMLKRIINDIEVNGGNDFVVCIAAGNTNGRYYCKSSSAAYGYVETNANNPKAESGGVLAEYNHFLSCIKDPDILNRIIVVGAAGIDYSNSTSQETRYEYAYFSCTGSRVDVVAPGVDIYSLNTTDYELSSGTSMATPHVTGTAALAFAANPSLSGPTVKNLIVSLTNGRFYYQDGYAGMVDAGQVTRAALSMQKGNYVPTTTNKAGLDLCFVVDTTASMGDDIQNAKDNMVNILSKLSEKSKDYRVALVDYRDFSDRTGDGRDYSAATRLNFSQNNEAVMDAINSLDLGNGGDHKETVYSALHEALTLSWRPRAQKVIIILGDAPPLDPEPITGYTYDDVILALYNADIGIDLDTSDSRVLGDPDSSAISVYSIGTGDYDEFFEHVAEDTGGAHTNTSSADEVSDAIMQSIEQIEMESTEAKVNLGRDMSNETVELYRDDEYAFSFRLNDTGSFTLEAVEPGDYEWQVKRLGKSGSMTIKDDDDKARVSDKEQKWYSFALVLWYRHRVALFVVPISILVLLVLFIIIRHKIKKRDRIKQSMPPAGQPEKKAQCPSCGTEIVNGADFCIECGTPLAGRSGKKAQCPSCGAMIKDNGRFCTECGALVEKPVEGAPVTPEKIAEDSASVVSPAETVVEAPIAIHPETPSEQEASSGFHIPGDL